MSPLFEPGEDKTLPVYQNDTGTSRRLAWAGLFLAGAMSLLGLLAAAIGEWIAAAIIGGGGLLIAFVSGRSMWTERQMLHRMRKRSR
jgi:hypothetical protein